MPTPRTYSTNAARQAAYRTRKAVSSSPPPLCPPARSGVRRWHLLIAKAHLLLQEVAAEMAAYEAARSDAWHDSERGEQFAARSELLQDDLSLLDDLTDA